MKRQIYTFLSVFVVILVIDQAIKYFFVSTNYQLNGEYISLVLAYNTGVAFSMFAFLAENLKFIQLALIFALFGYLLYEKKLLKSNLINFAMIFGSGISNILDRFTYGAVVDYVFWHKWFEFAIFNFADVMINISVFLIIIKNFIKKEKDE
ncbi:signal peptidase II [Campylobacter pinnipediorum subsp. pinnipediorum]|uniref:signal peptidase II n=1 Tax=Campylobacter pinnipediorum TaxID=1965231 RepID=UPI000994ADE9|nr:signal peptidase II [Campylobacter pinnipediorum]OPA74377.1 signal peptidase II [Campylobacter pinnipediorum subsp. pinnipediorum]